MRKTLIAGNWKMHTTVPEARALAAGAAAACGEAGDREVLLAPPFTTLSAVADSVRGSAVLVAGQNVCWEGAGPFTGEISPPMLQEAGATAAIVGHSERRQVFGEDDALVNRRLRGGLRFGLLMILCLGETLDQRQSGQTLTVLEHQVTAGLEQVAAAAMDRVVLAYEPVWAIGTGQTASTEQAQEAHEFIRGLVAKLYQKEVAGQTRILYGGSVKPTNIDDLMAQPDIDGALVGGAALDQESFSRIILYRVL